MNAASLNITAAELKARLDRIVGERTPTTARSAARLSAVENYLEEELAAMGLRVESVFFPCRGRTFRTTTAPVSARRRSPLVVRGCSESFFRGRKRNRSRR